MDYQYLPFFSKELIKLAYGEKEHRALAGIQSSPSLGYGPSLRKAVQQGSLRVDSGMTNPENPRNIMFFNRAHSSPFLDVREFGDNIVQQQRFARQALVDAARTGSDDALALFAAHAGRGSHMLVDRSAHTDKGLEKGYALTKIRNNPIARKIPGMGEAVEAVEHVVSNQMDSGQKPSIRKAVLQVVDGLRGGETPFDSTHKTDQLSGTKADKRAIERSKRQGRVLKRQAINQLMKEDGLDIEAATKLVEEALQREVNTDALERGLRKAENRFAVGEVKRRLKKNPISKRLVQGFKKLR